MDLVNKHREKSTATTVTKIVGGVIMVIAICSGIFTVYLAADLIYLKDLFWKRMSDEAKDYVKELEETEFEEGRLRDLDRFKHKCKEDIGFTGCYRLDKNRSTLQFCRRTLLGIQIRSKYFRIDKKWTRDSD